MLRGDLRHDWSTRRVTLLLDEPCGRAEAPGAHPDQHGLGRTDLNAHVWAISSVCPESFAV